ncbi:hypothetical protein EA462_05230 [Natrarchaeobius halalkaliphilus]|uniref:Uncharacterized protein n=1 Tax=Natrarchaeobius halalkaliphilus TaxID=1679091 RepID=A0A3N6LPI1_9EURY|nr:hypothetical protein EA462_05230 [Natrarchaeobius halalkaliphilus]
MGESPAIPPGRAGASEASDQPRSGEGAARRSSQTTGSPSSKRLLTDGGRVESEPSLIRYPPVKPPTISETGQGHRYVRCTRGDNDDTVYIHQLCAIAAGADPYDVFGKQYDVRHVVPTEWLGPDAKTAKGTPILNTTETVALAPIWARCSDRFGEIDRSEDEA